MLLTAGGDDYQELSASSFDVILLFNDENRRLSFQVTIVDDDLLESIECFILELRFDPFRATPSGVILSPNVSIVYIVDDDNSDINIYVYKTMV